MVVAAFTLVNFGYLVLHPLISGPEPGLPYTFLYGSSVLIIGVSLAVILLARSKRLTSQSKLDLGLVYEVMLAAVIGFSPQLIPGPILLPGWGASWVCIVVLLFPVIIPNSKTKILMASLIAASMDPLGIWVAGLLGKQIPSLKAIVVAYRINYLCAGMALVPSHVLQRLSRKVSEAREMGAYRLLELLGQGGMGEVWRAEHRMLRRNAAIKIIRPSVLDVSTEEADRILRRFEREAQATATLRSPHTVELYDFGINEEGIFYYVMELLDGIDLKKLIARFGPQPPERVAHVLRQTCHSLQNAHGVGLLHRDIKPANIFVCRMGEDFDFVKVLDFGLVRSERRASSTVTDLTAVQTIVGTPAYIAPEIIRGEYAADGRSDIYSLGCVAYYLLTGRAVFEGKSPMQVFIQHVEETPIPPSEICETAMPIEFEQVVLRCLAKNPSDRFQKAKELSDELARIQFSSPWTDVRMSEWWRTHLPEGTPEESL
jgi:serine/threonine-protein kinase